GARVGGLERAHGGDERQVLLGREVFVERRIFRGVSEMLLGLERARPQIDACNLNAAFVRRLKARGGSEHRALAGAVGAEQSDDLAALNDERRRVQREQRSVTTGEPFDGGHQRSSAAAQRRTRRRGGITAGSSTIRPMSGT